jgi:tetratricopeptide (TPR) repeat protein
VLQVIDVRQHVTALEGILLAVVLLIGTAAAALVGPQRQVIADSPQPASAAPLAASKDYVGSAGYDYFLRARVLLASENEGDTDRSITLLRQAVAADPHLAPAHAELARAYRNKAFFFADDSLRRPLNEEAAVAVEKALMLDPELPDAHFARGLLIWSSEYRYPHAEAIASFKRTLELDPHHDEAHHNLGMIFLHLGLFDQAWAELETAVRIDPGNTLARYRLGVVELYRETMHKHMIYSTARHCTKLHH